MAQPGPNQQHNGRASGRFRLWFILTAPVILLIVLIALGLLLRPPGSNPTPNAGTNAASAAPSQ